MKLGFPGINELGYAEIHMVTLLLSCKVTHFNVLHKVEGGPFLGN